MRHSLTVSLSELSSRPTDAQGQIAARVVLAIRELFDVELELTDALVRPSARDRDADFQSGIAMRLAKQLRRAPIEVAEAIAAELQPGGVIGSCDVSAPGFVNVHVAEDWLDNAIAAIAGDDRLGVPIVAEPKRVVIDYSAPNVAKEMHVGHLRSTIIGDALIRLHRFVGDVPIAQNHVGDWGTPFGMLLEDLAEQGWNSTARGEIADLDGFYRAARARFDSEPQFADRARQRVVLLQSEDTATLELWQLLVAESERHFAQIYTSLGVLLSHEDLAGESIYRHDLDGVVSELTSRGVAENVDGTVCVFLEGFTGRDEQPLPLILQKRDGGYTYGATDLAAIRHRVNRLNADSIEYVVGSPQQLHLSMVLAAARKAGWLPESVTARHVAFGSVLGTDGRMLRTRAGANIKLIELLDEAKRHAAAVLNARSPDAEDQPALAEAIGIGAVKYADLSTDRERDYTFSFDRMLALDGNTSVYLQYANARALSVLQRADRTPDTPPGAVTIRQPAERALALQLLAFPAAVEATVQTLQPHRLCGYLYETAAAFSSFYDACSILGAPDDESRASRLTLTATTHRTITLGLSLLGIEAPQRL